MKAKKKMKLFFYKCIETMMVIVLRKLPVFIITAPFQHVIVIYDIEYIGEITKTYEHKCDGLFA